MARRRGSGGAGPKGKDRELEGVRKRIEHWRKTRKKRTRMPEELWSAAVSLADGRGIYAVARGLGVNYESLKSRVLEAGGDGGSSSVASSGFVELSTSPGFGSSQVTGSVVELTRGGDTRLTIRLPAGEPLDVAGLASAFLGGSR